MSFGGNPDRPIDFVFVAPGADHDAAAEAMADIYGKANVISNTKEMVGRIISTCIHYGKQIGSITFVSHGSFGGFRIGREAILDQTLDPSTAAPSKRYIYYALSSLRPYFHSKAMVYIQACHTGGDYSFLRKLSRVLGVPVVAWTGEIVFQSGGWSNSIDYEPGKMAVCIGNMCNYAD